MRLDGSFWKFMAGHHVNKGVDIMKRKLWVNWEDRCLMWDEIDDDLIIDTMVDICYETIPNFEEVEIFSGDVQAELEILLGIEKFEEIKKMTIEKVESRFEYFEI